MSGSTVTKAEAHTMLQNAVDVLESIRAWGNGTLIAKIGTLQESLQGDYPPSQMAATSEQIRASLASGCTGSIARALLTPVLREYGILAASPFARSNDITSLLRDVYLYWTSESDTVETRAITFGTITANGSNSGDGTLTRLTVDAKGEPLEAVHVEAKTFECVADQNTGTDRHSEMFRAYGVESGFDSLEVSGSGESTRIWSRHAGTDRNKGSLLKNSSFQTHDGTTNTDQFDGWTFTSGNANAAQDTTDNTANYFRSFPGDTASGLHSLKLSGNAVITQKISVRNENLSKTRPYALRVMYNRATGSGTMTLRIRMGSQTTTVALSAQTGWNELTLTLDANSWYENFSEDELDVTIEVESYSTGYVLIDDVIFCPLTFWDGTWWFMRGGATPWLAANASLPEGDSITVTDTGGAASTAKIQYWWWRAFNRFLPSDATPTVADP